MKIVISPRGFANYGLEEIEIIKKNNIEVHYNDTGQQYSYEEFLECAEDADGLIVGVDCIDKKFIDRCPNLKVICKFGVGTDNIDVEYAQSKHIKIKKTIGTNTNSVAEHVIAMMFADSKNLINSINEVRENKWIKPTGRELKDKTLGIVGFGAIGKALASFANGIGMKVIVFDIFELERKQLEIVEAIQVSFEEVLKQSDYLSLHLPLTKETENLVNSREFNMMKSDSCIINTARGGIVNETALYDALVSKKIRSACFDVFSSEPPNKEEALLSLDNFFLTPHTAARTMEAEKRTCHLSTKLVLEELGVEI